MKKNQEKRYKSGGGLGEGMKGGWGRVVGEGRKMIGNIFV